MNYYNLIIKCEQVRDFFLCMSKENGLLRWNLCPLKMLWGLLKWNKGFRILHKLVYKAVAGCERIDHNSERSSTVSRILLNSIMCYGEFIRERVNWCNKLHYFLILRNCHSHLNLQEWPSWMTTLHQQRLWLLENTNDSIFFSNEVFLNLATCIVFVDIMLLHT